MSTCREMSLAAGCCHWLTNMSVATEIMSVVTEIMSVVLKIVSVHVRTCQYMSGHVNREIVCLVYREAYRNLRTTQNMSRLCRHMSTYVDICQSCQKYVSRIYDSVSRTW